MRTQSERSWVLLTNFVGCAGLAWTLGFAAAPDALIRLTQADDNIQKPGETAQITYLAGLLQSSSQFRVRAQAAISLGLIDSSLAARDALTAAMRDEQPAVRAAAAMSLGRIGNGNHIGALRKLETDPEEPVRNAARSSIGRLNRAINHQPADLETAATTAALSDATRANRW